MTGTFPIGNIPIFYQLPVLQAGPASSDVARAIMVPTIFIIFIVIALFLVIWYVKEYFKRSPVAEIDREFRAEKDTLLIMAEAKKMEREKQAEQLKIREKIMEEIGGLSVDVESFAKSCPHCMLDHSEDMEIVYFIEQKFGVHRACFADFHSANPNTMSKYLYIHPEGDFEYWDDFVESLPKV